jgi:hypothetical protein
MGIFYIAKSKMGYYEYGWKKLPCNKPSTATPNKLAHKKLLQLFFTCKEHPIIQTRGQLIFNPFLQRVVYQYKIFAVQSEDVHSNR